MSDALTNLRTCAYCPNTCRPSYPQDAEPQIESHTPSALSLVALAVLERRLPDGASTRIVLNRRAAALASRGHCTYGLDIPASLDATVGPAPDERS
jgi:hypothetical protein